MKKGIYLLGLESCYCLHGLHKSKPSPHFFFHILQRDMPIRVWGKADKNEVISVALNGSVQTAKTGKDGIWRVELPAMKAGGPYDMQIESAEETIGLTNILIGDVWVCSGQSNMEFGYKCRAGDCCLHFAGYPSVECSEKYAIEGAVRSGALRMDCL
ncbi:MAG: hypothetical protein ACLU6Z_08590 [Odoribacter splanchnicus]